MQLAAAELQARERAEPLEHGSILASGSALEGEPLVQLQRPWLARRGRLRVCALDPMASGADWTGARRGGKGARAWSAAARREELALDAQECSTRVDAREAGREELQARGPWR
jgi:hypothetical protein